MKAIKSIWDWAGKKLVVACVGLILGTLKAQHPDWPLPSEDLVRDIVIAFLSAHTLTDIAYIAKTAGLQVAKDVAAKL